MAHLTAARKRAEDAHNALRMRVAALDSDPRLDDKYRQRVKAHSFLKADALVAEARAAHQAEVAAERRTLETRAFGFPEDPDAFRAALDGASARITTPSQAASALARARRTGDAVAAHAVFVRAHELGFGDVVQRYTQDHPPRASALQDLADFDHGNDTPEESLFSALRPPMRPIGLPSDPGRLAQLAAESGEPPLVPGPDVVLRAR
jgi:hypothetical protein